MNVTCGYTKEFFEYFFLVLLRDSYSTIRNDQPHSRLVCIQCNIDRRIFVSVFYRVVHEIIDYVREVYLAAFHFKRYAARRIIRDKIFLFEDDFKGSEYLANTTIQVNALRNE